MGRLYDEHKVLYESVTRRSMLDGLKDRIATGRLSLLVLLFAGSVFNSSLGSKP